MRAVALLAAGEVRIVDDWPDIEAVGSQVTERRVGQLAPEWTVQGTFAVEDAAAALASVREMPGKSWIEFSSWRA